MQILIDHIGIGKYSARRCFIDEALFDEGNFVRIPDVVLVAQKDDVAIAGAYSGLKVTRRAEALTVRLEPYRKGRAPGEIQHNGWRCINGGIIRDNQLVRKTCLTRNTIELLADIAFTVVTSY